MQIVAYLIPALFLIVFLIALFRRVKIYDCFVDGVKEAAPLVLAVFPYLAAVLMLSELFERSGLSGYLTALVSPAFRFLGIPPEISKLVLLKPFSGSGSTALLSEIFASYGADSYIARCAAVCYGSSETVFYVLAVYFAGTGRKRLFRPALIALSANFVSVIFGCYLCRFL